MIFDIFFYMMTSILTAGLRRKKSDLKTLAEVYLELMSTSLAKDRTIAKNIFKELKNYIALNFRDVDFGKLEFGSKGDTFAFSFNVYHFDNVQHSVVVVIINRYDNFIRIEIGDL